MRLMIASVSILALLAASAIFLSGPGARLGLWDYGTGLSIIRQVALPTMIAAGAAVIVFFLSVFTARSLAPLAFIAVLAAGVAAFVPLKMRQLVEANPFIHDITTDFDNPPAIVAAADLERRNPPDYVGAEPAPRSELTTAEAQREAFPDIAPRTVETGLDETAQIVRAVVVGMNMEILDEGASDGGWTLEAAHTSLWFGFIDDFVVRLTPTLEGTRIDVRSKSRVGGSDLGANAKRVRDFFERLEKAS